MNEFLNLLLYFFIYSILGWIIESIYKSLIEKRLINSGFLHGPYCPIYGFGAVIMLLFLKRFSNSIVMLFIMGFLILSFWEYIVGILLEKIYHTKYWDYSNSKFNIKGRICLLNSIYWGILGVVFIKLIHPFMLILFSKISIKGIIVVDILLFSVFLIDFIISNVKVKGIDKKLKYLKEITEKIKEKILEIRKARKEKEKNEEFIKNLKHTLDELKIKQNKLKLKLYKQGVRLKKAFPTIQSDKINEIIKKDIDLRALKNKIQKIKESIK